MTTRALNIHPGAFTTMSRKTGSRTRALATRFSNAGLQDRPRATLAVTTISMSHAAEPSRPALEFENRFVERARGEVRPEVGGDPELGVRDLPQEEVRDPHLAARPDEEIGIGHVRRVQRATHVLLGDVRGIELSVLHVRRETPERVEELVPAAIVERHLELQPGVVPGAFHDALDATPHARRYAVGPPDHPEPHVLLHEVGKLGLHS